MNNDDLRLKLDEMTKRYVELMNEHVRLKKSIREGKINTVEFLPSRAKVIDLFPKRESS